MVSAPRFEHLGKSGAARHRISARRACGRKKPVQFLYACPHTGREADGLAMSSRNAYLDPQVRRCTRALVVPRRLKCEHALLKLPCLNYLAGTLLPPLCDDPTGAQSGPDCLRRAAGGPGAVRAGSFLGAAGAGVGAAGHRPWRAGRGGCVPHAYRSGGGKRGISCPSVPSRLLRVHHLCPSTRRSRLSTRSSTCRWRARTRWRRSKTR